jgi:hypothetical protein
MKALLALFCFLTLSGAWAQDSIVGTWVSTFDTKNVYNSTMVHCQVTLVFGPNGQVGLNWAQAANTGSMVNVCSGTYDADEGSVTINFESCSAENYKPFDGQSQFSINGNQLQVYGMTWNRYR